MENVNIGIILNSFVKSAPWWIYPPIIFLYIFHKWYPKQEQKFCHWLSNQLTRRIVKNEKKVIYQIDKINNKIDNLEKEMKEIKELLTNKK